MLVMTCSLQPLQALRVEQRELLGVQGGRDQRAVPPQREGQRRVERPGNVWRGTKSPPRQITFFGHGSVTVTSSIKAVVAIGDVVMMAWPINGSVAVATPVSVGSVVSETEAPFGTNEAAVPSEHRDRRVLRSRRPCPASGRRQGRRSPARRRRPSAWLSLCLRRLGRGATNSTVAVSLRWRVSRARRSAGLPTEQDPTLGVAESSTSPPDSSTSAVTCVADWVPVVRDVRDVGDEVRRLVRLGRRNGCRIPTRSTQTRGPLFVSTPVVARTGARPSADERNSCDASTISHRMPHGVSCSPSPLGRLDGFTFRKPVQLRTLRGRHSACNRGRPVRRGASAE